MPTARTTAASVLEGAFDGGNEDRLIEELRQIASRKSRRQPRIALAAQILAQTGSPRVRNAAALALADMRAREATDALIDALKNPETKGHRGTLLYALDQLDAALPISLLVDLTAEDSYEAREEALHLIANEKFEWDEDPRQILGKLLKGPTFSAEPPSRAIVEFMVRCLRSEDSAPKAYVKEEESK